MELPKRKNIRLLGYDYASCGAYFCTVCLSEHDISVWDNAGADFDLTNNPPTLSEYGKTVEIGINNISAYYPHIVVDKYCIMPNHIHLIIFILPDVNGRMISAR